MLLRQYLRPTGKLQLLAILSIPWLLSLTVHHHVELIITGIRLFLPHDVSIDMLCMIIKEIRLGLLEVIDVNGMLSAFLATLCSLIALSSLHNGWMVRLFSVRVSSLPVCQLLFTSKFFLDLLELLLLSYTPA